MNRNGFIVYSDYANETVNYLMVLDTANGSDKTGDRKLAKADVLFADNSVKKDVEFASDLTIDDKSNGNTGYNKSNRHWKEELVVGNVYKYWQNEDGVITKMESMFSADAERENDYTYDESADRLKEGGTFVASLEEADVIFAVTGNYIDAKNGNLYVDDSNVMAVKQSDIPEIVSKDEKDTNDTKAQQMTKTEKTWLNTTTGASDDAYIAEVDKNGEASAAILGVNNFNKFNDASTTVGLVTSVSYDKNDVVEVEVAYKGEVTTVKSAEDVDFEDIVKQYDGAKDNDLTTKQAANKLKDNALYAEITTDADGKLTAVTFMNVDGNVATGHYYEVSRRIITNVKSGNVAYGEGDYYYYNNKNLYSVGRLPVDDTDLADTVYYYTIDGRPTTHADKYEDVMMAVANGFDGTPDITAESDSTLINSYVNNKFDDVDDYQVADLATKMGDDEIVAAYAFEDTLGEYPTVDKIVLDKTSYSVVAPTYGATAKTVDISWNELGEINVEKAELVGTYAGVSLKDFNVSDNAITVEFTDGVVAGDVVVRLTDDKGNTTDVTIKVTADADNTLTVEPVKDMPKMTALTDGTAATIANVKVNDAIGTFNAKVMQGNADVSALFDIKTTGGELKVGTKDTTPAGDYTVVVYKQGYADASVAIKVEKVSLGAALKTSTAGNIGMTTTLTNAALKAADFKLANFKVEVKDSTSAVEYREVAIDDVTISGTELGLMLGDNKLAKGTYDVKVTISGATNVNDATVTDTVTVA